MDVSVPGRLCYTAPAREALAAGTVLVETALVPAALEHARWSAASGTSVCFASTGLNQRQHAELEGLSARVPVVLAPNLSQGVTVLLELVRAAARALPGYDLEIVEMHHRRKRDAPSGTAWALAREAAGARGRDIERDAILARAGETGPRGVDEIGLQTLRGGEVLGEHTVFLLGDTERLELTHRAGSRDAFALGALSAIRFLARQRAPGLYGMRDVVGLGDDDIGRRP